MILPPVEASHNDQQQTKVTADLHTPAPAGDLAAARGQGDAATCSDLAAQGQAEGHVVGSSRVQTSRQGSPTSTRSVSFLCDETSDVTGHGELLNSLVLSSTAAAILYCFVRTSKLQ